MTPAQQLCRTILPECPAFISSPTFQARPGGRSHHHGERGEEGVDKICPVLNNWWPGSLSWPLFSDTPDEGWGQPHTVLPSSGMSLLRAGLPMNVYKCELPSSTLPPFLSPFFPPFFLPIPLLYNSNSSRGRQAPGCGQVQSRPLGTRPHSRR